MLPEHVINRMQCDYLRRQGAIGTVFDTIDRHCPPGQHMLSSQNFRLLCTNQIDRTRVVVSNPDPIFPDQRRSLWGADCPKIKHGGVQKITFWKIPWFYPQGNNPVVTPDMFVVFDNLYLKTPKLFCFGKLPSIESGPLIAESWGNLARIGGHLDFHGNIGISAVPFEEYDLAQIVSPLDYYPSSRSCQTQSATLSLSKPPIPAFQSQR